MQRTPAVLVLLAAASAAWGRGPCKDDFRTVGRPEPFVRMDAEEFRTVGKPDRPEPKDPEPEPAPAPEPAPVYYPPVYQQAPVFYNPPPTVFYNRPAPFFRGGPVYGGGGGRSFCRTSS